MQSIEFAGTVVKNDREATEALYAIFIYNWCQCDGCSHFRDVKTTFFPPQMALFLRQLGIDPFEPMYLTSLPRCRAPKGMRRYEGHYGAIGRIEGASKTPRLSMDKRTWIWADTRGCKWHSRGFLDDEYKEFPEPRILIQFSIILPE